MEIYLIILSIVVLIGVGFVLGFKYAEICTKELIKDGVLKLGDNKWYLDIIQPMRN